MFDGGIFASKRACVGQSVIDLPAGMFYIAALGLQVVWFRCPELSFFLCIYLQFHDGYGILFVRGEV